MCGIAGVLAGGGRRPERELILQMAGELRHRGPDGTGLVMDGPLGMVNTRLATIDVAGGDQPIGNEDGRYWVIQNGEIYNHIELRAELITLGHSFRTRSDTEVLVHAFEEWGTGCLQRLNGEFAFAVWDSRSHELFIARDRFGVRPLFLASYGNDFLFASEGRALLRHPLAVRELDPEAITQTFTLWSTLPGGSALKGISELPAGHWLKVRPGQAPRIERWWDLDFSQDATADAADLALELRQLLADAVSIRTRADVPVGAYVSGGLDSSVIVALLREAGTTDLRGFGIGFADARFDESKEQDLIASAMGISLDRVVISDADLAASFPRVVELSERPMLRTAPAPMLRLSAMARAAGFKVVLTGEGADELFGGYNLFKEAMVRRFWARDPESRLRPLLFARLYPYVADDFARAGGMLQSYFGAGMTETDDPLYSHRIRHRNGVRNLRFLTPEARGVPDPAASLERLLPPGFAALDGLSKAQYLEVQTFMQGYLLHSQGDRMLMGSGVEGRFPFLDHRVAEFAARLPSRLRLRGLQEKYLLRKAVGGMLPVGIAKRTKRPYRAPLLRPFLQAGAPDWVTAMLDPANVAASGLFDAQQVGALAAKAARRLESGNSEADEMALTGVLSTLLLKQQLVDHPRLAEPAVPDRVIEPGLVGA